MALRRATHRVRRIVNYRVRGGAAPRSRRWRYGGANYRRLHPMRLRASTLRLRATYQALFGLGAAAARPISPFHRRPASPFMRGSG